MDVLLVTNEDDGVLPALSLLAHTVRSMPRHEEPSMMRTALTADIAIVDARSDVAAARDVCRCLAIPAASTPVVAVLTEGDLVTVTTAWGVDDILLPGVGPAELDARLRLVVARRSAAAAPESSSRIRLGDLVLDEGTYAAHLCGKPLNLTYKEYELLKYLASHPGQVFSRAQLLQQVWGFEFFGGTRTVDVHVRRVRAKLGAENQWLIGTVRKVGYKAMFIAAGKPSPG